VFEGRAGLARAILVGLTAGGLVAGAMFAATASSRGNEAGRLAGSVVQRTGSFACNMSEAGLVSDCRQILELRQQHDTDTTLARSLLVGAAVTGTAAVASILLFHMPATSTVQVRPAAPGSLAGLTLETAW
jgi:hypothetical protein